ncbi:MAG: peptidoglycan recognition family protein [Phycisphaerae bacterium]
MPRRTTRMLLSAVAAAALASGCAQTDPEPLARLVTPSIGVEPLPQPILRGRLAKAPSHDKQWLAENPRPWKYIVIHHSATDAGNAKAFDAAHRGRGWDELGYHFVINNGSGGADGQVEVGSRWVKQKHGAHTGGTPENEYNELGIGVCLVGDFTRARPSDKQSLALTRLVEYLSWRFKIPPSRIIGHCQAPETHTSCPGDMLLDHIAATWQDPESATVAKARDDQADSSE